MRVFALIALVALAIVSAFTQSGTPNRWAPITPTPPKQAAKPTPKKTAATTTTSRPRPTPKKLDEKAEWDKANALTDPSEKVAALQKFNTAFPKSDKLNDSLELIATTRAAMAADKAATNDVDGAATLYKLALTEGPAKFSDAAVGANLAKAPADLYFRGRRAAAIEVAKLLEDKAEGNATQLMPLAQFYLATENGGEAKRITAKVIAVTPTPLAYLTLGMAARMQFSLDDAAAAYQKALELDPDSMPARRGLAEMKRALGKPDEAAKLYQEILAKDAANNPARTGLIMALFESGKQADAEAELAKAIEANPSNVILMASAAYWYAANGVADKAVDLAQKAVDADSRFIWSHIALARGLMLQGKAAEAEKVLLRAQRYGNFPTIQYELASVKMSLGYYKEASEQLTETFSIADGLIHANLGGRVERSAKGFAELLEDERRASIFAPTAADTSANSAKLAALLAFQQALDAKDANAEGIAKAADDLVKGDDRNRTFRQIYVAGALIDKGVGYAKAIEVAKQATAGVDAALDAPNASTLVLASELYDSRHAAIAKGEYVRVPDVPRATLSGILRGRIEELQGWAMVQTDDKEGGLTRLRRAVSVLPANSSYWREAYWRLGSALALSGKDAEALDSYIKSYKDGPPNGFRYSVIEGLYKRLNGSMDGLEDKIGKNPTPAETVAKVESSPTPDPSTQVTPTPEPAASASPTPTPTPDTTVVKVEASPSPSKDLFPPVVIAVPTPPEANDNKADAAIKPCKLTSSEESLTLQNGGGDLAVIIGTEDDRAIDGITATPSSPTDISVRREAIVGVKAKALFVVKSLTATPGVFQLTFELPCGKRDLVIKVR